MRARLVVNGSDRDVATGTTIAELVAEVTGRDDLRGVAVAIDGAVVPRSAWAAQAPEDGQHVEILTAVQGG